ncbi:MAG: DUF4097 family beta strand repeat-containing protein [bacterium]
MTITMRNPLQGVLAACAALLVALPTVQAADDVKPATVEKLAAIAREKASDSAKAGEPVHERILAEIQDGEIELAVDPKSDETTVRAEFTVDGESAKDVERREQLVRVYAERAADGTIVVQAMFPGKPMKRDRVRVAITTPGTGDSMVKSVNGAITVHGTAGSLRVATKNGSIKVAKHTGSVDATAQTGAIEVALATDGVRATSTNGSVRVSLADGNDHPFEIESKAGAVDLELPATFDGAVRVTTVSGAITLDDPAKRARTPEIGDHSLTAEFGAGVGQSSIETTAGSVVVRLRAQ